MTAEKMMELADEIEAQRGKDLYLMQCDRDLIVAALRSREAREALMVMGEWQPIETAPKDGTFIVVFVPGRIQDTMAWDKSRGCWMNGYNDWPEQPTHWIQLPDPPQLTASTGDNGDG